MTNMIDFSNPTTAVLVTTTIVATVLFFCYALIGNFRESKRTHEWLNLHRPLHPSAIDLRLDAALRDAQDGFNVCDTCNFENLKRSIFCTICGAPIDMAMKKRKDTLHAQRQLAAAHQNRRRQARALKRKEWARKVDAKGKLYWFQGGRGANDGVHSQNYVLQFQGDPLVVATEAQDQATTLQPPQPEGELFAQSGQPTRDVAITINVETELPSATATSGISTPGESAADSVTRTSDQPDDDDDTTQNKQATDKPKITLLSLDDVTHQLTANIASHPMALTNHTLADPGRPAITIKAESEFREEPKTLVANAQLNFPSKVAEFVTRASTALLLSDTAALKFKIRRDYLLEDSIAALAATPVSCSRSPLRLTFVGEQGIDAGGVYREWLVLVSEQLVTAEAGIFRCVDTKDRTFYLNPMSQHDIGEHHLAHYFATGRLLGRVLLEGNVTGFHLALPLLKIIVGQPVTFSDLEYFDPEAYKSLLWLLNNDGVEDLGLDFTVTELTAKGESIVVELIPGGRNIDVTDNNKFEYVDCKLKYLLFNSVASQLFAFLKGFYEVMPPEMLMLFDAEELDYVLSGSDEIDVDDWERNSKYTADLIEHPVREWFWDLVREMPNEYRRRLLLFATGSSRVPLAGFMALTSYDGRLCPFILKGVDMAKAGEYIHSHACFNRLDLPRYRKKKDLKAVLYGILDTDMYGFTTA